jgi:hypothetical protein
MHRDKDKLLQCRECGSHTFEVRDLVRKKAVVRCAKCHAKIAPLDEFMASIEQEKKRRFH